ncbi:DUF2934 domain-containing protein [Nitrosomonas sp. Nm166]|uniref:DUF2934 domain-containing protein n=1 Tax=Nitrosomonas sp. Nm166 TaxID=1881054 RepID=UPI0008F05857|nr:DUF2934 domain-containing protein [Nitrosomonas sp. Nm166]SFD91977.1 Protein of unknown function [Nitrosomonas sp. Nm166]
MAKQTRTPVNQKSNSDVTSTPEQREAMIREAAYHRYAKRGYIPGHDLDDWLAAEAELEHRMPESQEFSPEMEVQQSGMHGPAKDDELKRMIRQHPQKAIPQVESMEPEKAPFKE